MAGTLYLVATPIGNLGDMSSRGADTLAAVDFIAAEDTRVTRKLLSHLGIRTPLMSYYAHNRLGSGAKILERLLSGESCALVSDAGMPAISDPGEELVALCAENDIPVTCIPGASAFVTALAVSGLKTGRFTFEGFLSTAGKRRSAHLNELKLERRTMVFYEAPHKLQTTLSDMLEAWGDRRLSICRELTKFFEETLRTTLSGAVAHFAGIKPKGEFVLVIEGNTAEKPTASLAEALDTIRRYRSEGMSLKEAARRCSAETGLSKNVLYTASLSQDKVRRNLSEAGKEDNEDRLEK